MNNTKPLYPSMEEILEKQPPKLNPKTLDVLKLWKKAWYKNWKNLIVEEKLRRLNILIEAIWEIETPEHRNTVAGGDYYAWHPGSRTLLVDFERPSIISTLHEIGHSIMGASELDACRYSVWLFKTVFPKSFNSLKTEGHMLKLSEKGRREATTAKLSL